MGWISAGLGLVSAITGKKSADKSAQQSMTGFNYLKSNETVQGAQDQGGAATGLIGGLLGFGDQAQSEAAFDQYKESTGYQTRLNEGVDAITGSAAAKGLLNSGSTAKGITRFGQSFASNEFGNYLAQLQQVQGQGLTSAFNVASQGTSGGARAAEYTTQGTSAMNEGLSMAAGGMYKVGQNRGWFG